MSDPSPHLTESDWLPLVQKSVENLQFGEVLITVHHGEVVQVTRTETTRLVSARSSRTRHLARP